MVILGCFCIVIRFSRQVTRLLISGLVNAILDIAGNICISLAIVCYSAPFIQRTCKLRNLLRCFASVGSSCSYRKNRSECNRCCKHQCQQLHPALLHTIPSTFQLYALIYLPDTICIKQVYSPSRDITILPFFTGYYNQTGEM